MRHSKAMVAAGNVRRSAFGMRRALVIGALLLLGLWTAFAFAQEAYIGHKLSQQAADLNRQNLVLAAQNQGYRKDVQAITSGTASEEEARLNGYARAQERVYLVTVAPSPSPTSPTPSATPSH
jgi:parvulin-like peptidyl-prolyl isomerase